MLPPPIILPLPTNLIIHKIALIVTPITIEQLPIAILVVIAPPPLVVLAFPILLPSLPTLLVVYPSTGIGNIVRKHEDTLATGPVLLPSASITLTVTEDQFTRPPHHVFMPLPGITTTVAVPEIGTRTISFPMQPLPFIAGPVLEIDLDIDESRHSEFK
jgi:hypothetical protein